MFRVGKYSIVSINFKTAFVLLQIRIKLFLTEEIVKAFQ